MARKLLSTDAPALQKALTEILYQAPGGGGGGARMRTTRLVALLSAALGGVAKSDAFFDLDAASPSGLPLVSALKLLLSPVCKTLREGPLLDEAVSAGDVLLRDAVRRGARPLQAAVASPPLSLLPPPRVPVPLSALRPSSSFSSSASAASFAPTRDGVAWFAIDQLLDAAAPKLSRSEELLASSLADGLGAALGIDARAVASGSWVPLSLAPAGPGGLLRLPVFTPLPGYGQQRDAHNGDAMASALAGLAARGVSEAAAALTAAAPPFAASLFASFLPTPGADVARRAAAAAGSALRASARTSSAAAGAAADAALSDAPPAAAAATDAGDVAAVATAMATLEGEEAETLRTLIGELRARVSDRVASRLAAAVAAGGVASSPFGA